MEFSLVTLKSGMKSLRSLERNETFHPTSGPLKEANILHVDQQRLVERASGLKKFVIWDVGLGAAANVIAAIQALTKGLGESRPEIVIHSFDQSTAPLEFALASARELGYLMGHEARLRELLLRGRVSIDPCIRWLFHLGDFSEAIRDDSLDWGSPNAILYDPYSPATNPEMWTLGHFSRLRKRMSDGTACLFTNYTRSTAVRVALLLAGFYVGQGCVIGEKDETTLASTQLDLIERPLGAAWLSRVQKSTNAAPLRQATYSKAPISETDFLALKGLPQFGECVITSSRSTFHGDR